MVEGIFVFVEFQISYPYFDVFFHLSTGIRFTCTSHIDNWRDGVGGYLVKNYSVPLPACAVTKIRALFTSEQVVRFISRFGVVFVFCFFDVYLIFVNKNMNCAKLQGFILMEDIFEIGFQLVIKCYAQWCGIGFLIFQKIWQSEKIHVNAQIFFLKDK